MTRDRSRARDAPPAEETSHGTSGERSAWLRHLPGPRLLREAPAPPPEQLEERPTAPPADPHGDARRQLQEFYRNPTPSGDGRRQMDALALIVVLDAWRALLKRFMDDIVEFARGMREALGGAGVGIIVSMVGVAASVTAHFLLNL